MIAELLRRDKVWNIFALADLYPPHDTHSRWSSNDSAVLLCYEAVNPPVVFAYGTGPGLYSVLAGVNEPKFFLHLTSEAVDYLKDRYQILWDRKMLRMYLPSATGLQPVFASNPPTRLTPSDLPDIEALYADGAETAESPNFFYPSMLETGEFWGLRENGQLVSAAGTHIVEPAESVGLIGNVYTHRRFRARGFGEIVTTAVIHGLRARCISTIALNVNQTNQTAIRIYERLGFLRYCEYLEGVAERK